jgi:hypothetical protein
MVAKVYVTRDGAGKITAVSQWPMAGAVDMLSSDPTVIAYQNEKTANSVRAEFKRRIALAFDGKRDSIVSYGIKLNGLVSIGLSEGKNITQSLTPEQYSDVQMLWALDDWEDAMVTKREAIIASEQFADAFVDANWPAPPPGLTADWLKGF